MITNILAAYSEGIAVVSNARIHVKIMLATIYSPTAEARKLEHELPPVPKQRKQHNQHTSSYIHVVIFWSLLYICIYAYIYMYTYVCIHI